MRTLRTAALAGALAAALFLVSACDDSGDTTTNSPSGSGSVTLQSASYSNPALRELINGATVTDFQFCITKVQLTDDTGAAVTDDTGASSIEAILGLIDVSNPNAAVEWGVLDIPTGYQLSELMVEVHYDPENCAGAAFSLSYNGTALTQDLEFKFQFTPAISLDGGDVLNLALGNIAQTIQNADTAGQLTDQGITAYIENMVGEGAEE